MKSANPATALVRACLDLLALRGIFAWRNNSGAVKMGGRFVRFGSPGSPDVFAIAPRTGRLIGIECKHGKGRLNPDQRTFLDSITANGGLALVIRDVAALDAALQAEGF